MNRSILIVICDFLLVSLLVFSAVELSEAPDTVSRPVTITNMEMVTNRVESGQDLAVMMRMALDEEKKEREKLLSELTRTRSNLGEQESRLTERERELARYQQDLAAREEQARLLRQAQTQLEQQLDLAKTNVYALQTQLKDTVAEATRNRTQLTETEAELRRRADMAAALQRQIEDLSRSNQFVLGERQRLATQLQIAEVERRYATQQVAQAQQQVLVERQEKAKLAEGVQALASKSSELAEEIRDNRPLNPNTIFSGMVSNRVHATFEAERASFLGIDSNRRRSTATVLVSMGTNVYAVAHVTDTPFTFWNPGTDWSSLMGSLNRRGKGVPIRTLSFHQRDPRIVFIPLSSAEAQSLGVKPFKATTEPFKFQDAVVVGASEGYYGEARFEIDVSAPGYVRLDRSFVKGLFGQFNPSRGDLVFSKTGELLGVMANNSYCLVLQDFPAAATFQFTQDARSQRTGSTLAYLYSRVSSLPSKLQ